MALDPATMAALMQLGGSLIGGKELGAAAPAFQPGQTGGLLDGFQQNIESLPGGPSPDFDVNSVIGSLRPQEATQAPAPPVEQSQGDQGLLGSFFGGIDQTLQSPSKTIGLGLLGRVSPGLGIAGLGAAGISGLLGRKK